MTGPSRRSYGLINIHWNLVLRSFYNAMQIQSFFMLKCNWGIGWAQREKKGEDFWHICTPGFWNLLIPHKKFVFERFIYLPFHSLTNTYWSTIMFQILCEALKVQIPWKSLKIDESRKDDNEHYYTDTLKIGRNKEFWIRHLEKKGELKGTPFLLRSCYSEVWRGRKDLWGVLQWCNQHGTRILNHAAMQLHSHR